MLRGYEHAALTLNYVRALVDGGFADLHHPEYWDLDFVRHSPLEAEYRRIVQSIVDSLTFMETISGQTLAESGRIDLFTSHEGLHLLYEQAQTQFVPETGRWYNLATHYPWIGMRTAELGGAHVEYFRGIANPLAVKVGPQMTGDGTAGLVETAEPGRRAGPAHLHPSLRRQAHRRETAAPGAGGAEERPQGAVDLRPHARQHRITSNGLKTRRFENILSRTGDRLRAA